MIQILFLIATAFADSSPDAFIWTSGSVDGIRSVFPQSNVTVMSREQEAREAKAAGYLPPEERDALFRRSGIETKISSMDEYDRDLLLLSAREYSVAALKNDYPMLTESQVLKLKSELGKLK